MGLIPGRNSGQDVASPQLPALCADSFQSGAEVAQW